jgi:predicted secreted protein
MGNSGTDTWEFKVIANGESTLTITATRPFDKDHPATMFAGKVTVE